MPVIKFGKWCHKATSMFIYDRVYRNGYEWTPICIMKFRYVGGVPGHPELGVDKNNYL